MAYEDALSTQCPTRVVLDHLGSKWASLVLLGLCDGGIGYRELLRRIAGVSPKVLTQTLRSLERDGFVAVRRAGPPPAPSEYELTELGSSLLRLLATIIEWSQTRIDQIHLARRMFEAAPSGPLRAMPNR